MTRPARFNLREAVLRILVAAGPDGLTQVEIEDALAAIPKPPGTAAGHSVSGTLANLCNMDVVDRAGQRPGRTGRPTTVFAATGEEIRKGADLARLRQARERAATPLPEDKWPREVRRAVDTLRRRGWAVWPIDRDTWQAGRRRTTDQLLELADRIAPELAESEARA